MDDIESAVGSGSAEGGQGAQGRRDTGGRDVGRSVGRTDGRTDGRILGRTGQTAERTGRQAGRQRERAAVPCSRRSIFRPMFHLR